MVNYFDNEDDVVEAIKLMEKISSEAFMVKCDAQNSMTLINFMRE